HGPRWVAQEPGVHEREMPEIGEVLDLPRGVRVPRERPGRDGAPGPGFELGDFGQRPARLVERDPNQAVSLEAPEAHRASLGGHLGRIAQLRDGDARTVRVVPPAMIGADDLILLYGAEGKCRTAVNAQIHEYVRSGVGISPQDQALSQ